MKLRITIDGETQRWEIPGSAALFHGIEPEPEPEETTVPRRLGPPIPPEPPEPPEPLGGPSFLSDVFSLAALQVVAQRVSNGATRVAVQRGIDNGIRTLQDTVSDNIQIQNDAVGDLSAGTDAA